MVTSKDIPEIQGRLSDLEVRQSRMEGVVDQLSGQMSALSQGQRDLSNLLMQNRRDSVRDFWRLVSIQVTALLALGALILSKLG